MVAVEDGRVLGSLTLELDGRVRDEGRRSSGPSSPEEAHIRMLGVDPAARARGVARALMAASEARARAAGKTFMTLHTTRRMNAAQAMYERLGYERAGGPHLPGRLRPARLLEGSVSGGDRTGD